MWSNKDLQLGISLKQTVTLASSSSQNIMTSTTEHESVPNDTRLWLTRLALVLLNNRKKSICTDSHGRSLYINKRNRNELLWECVILWPRWTRFTPTWLLQFYYSLVLLQSGTTTVWYYYSHTVRVTSLADKQTIHVLPQAPCINI